MIHNKNIDNMFYEGILAGELLIHLADEFKIENLQTT